MSFQSPLALLLACRPPATRVGWVSTLTRQTRFIVASVARLIQALRRFGWKGVGRRIAYYGCTHSWLLGLADVQILSLLAFNPETGQEPMDSYLYLLASPVDLDAILLCSPLAERGNLRTLFQGFFASGFRCAIARHQDTVIGYNWAFTGDYTITLDDYRCHMARVELPPGTVFTGNAFVHPEYRGRGVIRRLKRFLFSSYPADTRFYTAVSDLNTASLRANGKVGFRKLALLRFARTPFGSAVYLKANDDVRWSLLNQHSPPTLDVVQQNLRAGR